MADTKISSMATHSSVTTGDYMVWVDAVGGDTNTALFEEAQSSFDTVGYASGNRTLVGGAAASANFIIQTTSNATKGSFNIGDGNTFTAGGAGSLLLAGTGNTLNLAINGGACNSIIGSKSSDITETGSATVANATIIGGKDCIITASAGAPTEGMICGGYNNQMSGRGQGMIIAGGVSNLIDYASTYSRWSGIFAGTANHIHVGSGAAIVGGTGNNMYTSHAFMAAGSNNIIAVLAAQFSATIAGSSNSITNSGQCAVIITGTGNTINCGVNGGAYNSIVGSQSSDITETGTGTTQNCAILGGLNTLITCAAGTITGALALGGEENTASHSHSTILGRGGATSAQYDFCWSNYDVAANDSTANVAIRFAGATADLHVGRHVNNANVGSNTNRVYWHPTAANTQAEYVGAQAPTTMTSSYIIFWPDAPGSAGDAMVVSAVSGNHIAMGWAAN